ncbi:hypothetical protein CEUSTIGMA_g10485.t1 [Chlamydomonas eustigma]|uniref:RRM domain-containing protein n=1 Tax=Chlamydomonas eustigma TaxID=1157962 RepID=A0A250XJG3_9CHLO|nr:hypothetical protein CEUSTIGMA_g10485.t1 [Chlamydomonas eustigma]|eukprot:GAX83059.1 hypothetical protein CEUSTIGMA_g10485.t1 [Chlamydomonas eustigma]
MMTSDENPNFSTMEEVANHAPDFNEIFSKLAVSERSPGPLAQNVISEPSSILKLKGLPYSATEGQIRDFFKEQSIKSVRFVLEPDGRPSGLAFAEFETREDAVKALTKNGDFLGERYVRLLHVPASEMEEQVRLGTLAVPGNAAKLRARIIRQQQQSRVLYMERPVAGPHILPSSFLPLGTQVLTLGQQQHIIPPPPMLGGRSVSQPLSWQQLYPQPMPSQQSPVPVASQLPNVSISAPLPYPSSFSSNQPDFRLQLSNQAMEQTQYRPLQQYGQMNALSFQQQPPLLNPPSSQILSAVTSLPPRLRSLPQQGGVGNSITAKVRGLPYRSSPSDILGFFEGYQYLPDSLQIGLDSLGRPSGEAWLSFMTPEEAMRAVRDLNRQYLGSRYLELSLC